MKTKSKTRLIPLHSVETQGAGITHIMVQPKGKDYQTIVAVEDIVWDSEKEKTQWAERNPF